MATNLKDVNLKPSELTKYCETEHWDINHEIKTTIVSSVDGNGIEVTFVKIESGNNIETFVIDGWYEMGVFIDALKKHDKYADLFSVDKAMSEESTLKKHSWILNIPKSWEYIGLEEEENIIK